MMCPYFTYCTLEKGHEGDCSFDIPPVKTTPDAVAHALAAAIRDALRYRYSSPDPLRGLEDDLIKRVVGTLAASRIQ